MTTAPTRAQPLEFLDGAAALPYPSPLPVLGHEGPWCPDCGYCTTCHDRCKKTGEPHHG